MQKGLFVRAFLLLHQHETFAVSCEHPGRISVQTCEILYGRQSAACAIVESILIIKYAVSLALTLAAELLARNVVRYAMKEDGL